MNGEDVPRCVACDCSITVEHILIECGDFAEVRKRYYDAESLQQLFQQINLHMYLTSFVRSDCFMEYRYDFFMITCE